MSGIKRGDEVPRPRPWRVVAQNTQAARGWIELQRSVIDALDRAWTDITADPRSMTNPHRQHQLKASLKAVKFGEVELEQWQYEVTGGGRIWYAIDDDHGTIWITKATTGHPGVTDKSGGRRLR